MSLNLGRKLLQKNPTVVGTIRKNRKELPALFVDEKGREVYSTFYGFQNNVTIICYCSKKRKVVPLPSTMLSVKGKEKGEEKIRTYRILQFNKRRC